MATTWIKSIHKHKNSTVVSTLADAIGYADNPEKSNGYEFVKSYGCDYYTAASEFALTKSLYHNVNGREQTRDVIAYHLRQSFKPGEIDPAQALEIGYELAMKFTHGKHQFVVAVHTDKEHIYCHCIFNSVTLDGSKKFRDFKRSDRALARISDHLCVKNGLSIIENPQRGQSYDKWLGENKPLGVREQLQFAIDSVVPRCKSWEEFLLEMKTLGFQIKRGAHIAFKLPEGKSFVRLKSLLDGYDEASIKSRIFGEKSFTPKARATAPAKVPQLLIDIQEKLQQGYGRGYEH